MDTKAMPSTWTPAPTTVAALFETRKHAWPESDSLSEYVQIDVNSLLNMSGS
jgi:hypothetical protein